MQPTPIPGFITKKETAEQFQRSHRQLTRDLADAMKVQNPKVLDHCRLRTEDGETCDGPRANFSDRTSRQLLIRMSYPWVKTYA